MKAAFTDSSALTAILLRESGWMEVRRLFQGVERLYAANLLEAEMRSVAVREKVSQVEVDSMLAEIKWLFPERPLSQELRAVSSCGQFLRGADSWHLACALYLAVDPANLPFVTLDGDQAVAAARLGFQVLPTAPSSATIAHEPGAEYAVHPRKTGGMGRKGRGKAWGGRGKKR